MNDIFNVKLCDAVTTKAYLMMLKNILHNMTKVLIKQHLIKLLNQLELYLKLYQQKNLDIQSTPS